MHSCSAAFHRLLSAGASKSLHLYYEIDIVLKQIYSNVQIFKKIYLLIYKYVVTIF